MGSTRITAPSHRKTTDRWFPLVVCGLASCGIFLFAGCRAGGDPSNTSVRTSSIASSAGASIEPSFAAISLVNFHDSESVEVEDADNPNPNKTQTTDETDNSEFAAILLSGQMPPESTSLDSLIALALATHPNIHAARQRVAAANHRIPQATALPDPSFSNTFWPIHDQALQTAGGRVGNQMMLGQTVPWLGKLDARHDVACREVQMAQAEVAKAEREVVEAVRLAYYELWLADALIRIVQDNEELVSDLITVSEARYKSGGSQQDVLRAELEGDKLANQLIELRRSKEQARADLGTLVRQPIDSMPVTADDLGMNEAAPRLEGLVSSAERCNPSLQGLAAEIARDRAKENLACQQQYPDLQLGIGWALISDNDDVISPVANGHDNVNFTVGVTLPIWRDKIDAGIREAAHASSSTIHRREAERDRLRGQLRRQVAAADAAVEQLSLFRDRLMPRTQRTLEIALADYQGKKADFVSVVDIYRELLAYQVQVARIQATLASTLAQIERTVGCATEEALLAQ